MKRNNNITVRFNDSEYQGLLDKAKGKPLATYIRSLICDGHSDSHDTVTVTECVNSDSHIPTKDRDLKAELKEYKAQKDHKNLLFKPEEAPQSAEKKVIVDSQGRNVIRTSSGMMVEVH